MMTSVAVPSISAMIFQAVGVPPDGASLSTFVVPALSAVVGGTMGYAMLKTTVQKMEGDIHKMQKDISGIHELLLQAMTKIARMEGRLDRPYPTTTQDTRPHD